MMFQHADFKLDYDDLTAKSVKNERRYETPDGKSYPSVTTVLSILSEDFIRKWRKRVGEDEANKVSHRASTRGTAVHSII